MVERLVLVFIGTNHSSLEFSRISHLLTDITCCHIFILTKLRMVAGIWWKLLASRTFYNLALFVSEKPKFICSREKCCLNLFLTISFSLRVCIYVCQPKRKRERQKESGWKNKSKMAMKIKRKKRKRKRERERGREYIFVVCELSALLSVIAQDPV